MVLFNQLALLPSSSRLPSWFWSGQQGPGLPVIWGSRQTASCQNPPKLEKEAHRGLSCPVLCSCGSHAGIWTAPVGKYGQCMKKDDLFRKSCWSWGARIPCYLWEMEHQVCHQIFSRCYTEPELPLHRHQVGHTGLVSCTARSSIGNSEVHKTKTASPSSSLPSLSLLDLLRDSVTFRIPSKRYSSSRRLDIWEIEQAGMLDVLGSKLKLNYFIVCWTPYILSNFTFFDVFTKSP